MPRLIGLTPETAARLKQMLGKDTTPPPPTRRRGGGGGGDGPYGPFVRGKLDGALSFGGSATLSIWAWNGTAVVDTGNNVTVYDWYLMSGQTVASGTQGGASWDRLSGRYIFTGTQCSA